MSYGKISGPSRKESKKPMIAGILMIIAFLLALVTAGSLFLIDEDLMADIEDEIDEDIDLDFVETISEVCGILLVVFGIILLVGGICAIKRIYWGVAIGGSIVGIFSLGPMYLGSVFSVIALILLFISKDEFDKKGERRPTVPPVYERTEEQQRQKESTCPDCGYMMQYEEEYHRFYCENCDEYK